MIFSYLYAIVYSGFWEIDDLKSWTLELIEKSEKCPWWLSEFALADNKEELMGVICSASYASYNSPLDKNSVCAVLGYYFLLYRSERISLTECIKLCSEFYDLYFDEDSNDFCYLLRDNEASACQEINKLCAEYKAEAERQYDIIRNFCLEA